MRGSTAAVFLGLRVRNPLGAWLSLVSVMLCQGERSLRRTGHLTRGVYREWCV